MSSVLKATNLCKKYVMPHKTVDVLNGISLEANKGELLAVVGRSGSGKSTLLNILGGIDTPDDGEVIIDGQSIFSASAAQRTSTRAQKIGFVFQAYHLLPEMTILENVMLPAMALNCLSKKEMASRARMLLERVGLESRLTHRPRELSGGEQQRVAIARALMNEPILILADEPTGNLDKTTGDSVLNLFFDLVRSQGISMIIVTHDSSVAERCDRCISLV